VYDALTSKRVYKGAFAHDVAKSMIAAESGEHLDPEVVAAFLRRESQFIQVYGRHTEQAAERPAGKERG
jgi:putative two-component system response regulator